MNLICPECHRAVAPKTKMCAECGCPMDYIFTHQMVESVEYSASSEREQLIEGADGGVAEAMYWLAFCLYYGENDFDEDEEAAEKWLAKAAEIGHQQAKDDYNKWFGFYGSKEKSNDIELQPQTFQSLLSKFDSLVIFDVETSGLNAETDQIIELAAIKVISRNGAVIIENEINEMIALPVGEHLLPKITELTGISDDILRRAGKPQEQVCKEFFEFLHPGNPLMVAYNAQFDLCFLQQLLRQNAMGQAFQNLHALDAMTIYKDRREYPHKLVDAIETYHLGEKVANTHRAIDDVKSLLEVLKAMDIERDDLDKYIDLFGYHPKYGVNGTRIPGIKYVAQPYNNYRKLYEM